MFELSKSDEIIEEQSSSVGIFETNGLDHGDEFLVDRWAYFSQLNRKPF